jgi:hypothetical protein
MHKFGLRERLFIYSPSAYTPAAGMSAPATV